MRDKKEGVWIVDGVGFREKNRCDGSLYGGVERGGCGMDINGDEIESI